MTKQFFSLGMGIFIGFFLFAYTLKAQSVKRIDDFQIRDINGAEINTATFHEKKAVVIVFTSANCAFATKYTERLKALHDQYANQEVSFLAVNSNDADMSPRDASSRLGTVSPFPFPYVKDSSQELARKLGATHNPEIFVLTPSEEGFEIAYQGMIDDNPLDSQGVKNSYAANALEAILHDRVLAVSLTDVQGCNIRWKNTTQR